MDRYQSAGTHRLAAKLLTADEMAGYVLLVNRVPGSTTIGGSTVGWYAQTVGDRWGLALGGFGATAAALL